MNLLELQRAFQHHVVHRSDEVLAAIEGSEQIPARLRLAVYAEGYQLRLTEALAHNFPRLQQLLGEERFGAIARRYLAEHPSSSVSVRWFGNRLAAHLEAQHADRPWLAELARWEWAIAAAFDAADAAPVSEAALGEVEPAAWPTLRFEFHASVQHLQLGSNAPALFKALSAEVECPPPCSVSPQRWLIWRQSLTPRYRSLAADEAQALDVLLAHGTFGDACEALCEWHEPQDVPAQAARLLKGCVTEGMIVGLTSSA